MLIAPAAEAARRQSVHLSGIARRIMKRDRNLLLTLDQMVAGKYAQVFAALRAGEEVEIPVIGGALPPPEYRTAEYFDELQATGVRALCTRKWHEFEAPRWAQPLPLTEDDCIALYNLPEPPWGRNWLVAEYGRHLRALGGTMSGRFHSRNSAPRNTIPAASQPTVCASGGGQGNLGSQPSTDLRRHVMPLPPPIPDQYAPGRIVQQALTWNVAAHQEVAGEIGVSVRPVPPARRGRKDFKVSRGRTASGPSGSVLQSARPKPPSPFRVPAARPRYRGRRSGAKEVECKSY